LIACPALSGPRVDLIERHARSLPTISLIDDDQAVRGIPVDCRSARDWSKLR